MRVIVTGGAGFIGSAVCRDLVRRGDIEVLNIDKLTNGGEAAAQTTTRCQRVRFRTSNPKRIIDGRLG